MKRTLITVVATGTMLVVPITGLPNTQHHRADVKVAATKVIKARMKPCKHEDSRGPCFWDAGRRGNKKGYSFWVTKSGRVVYLDGRMNRK